MTKLLSAQLMCLASVLALAAGCRCRPDQSPPPPLPPPAGIEPVTGASGPPAGLLVEGTGRLVTWAPGEQALIWPPQPPSSGAAGVPPGPAARTESPLPDDVWGLFVDDAWARPPDAIESAGDPGRLYPGRLYPGRLYSGRLYVIGQVTAGVPGLLIFDLDSGREEARLTLPPSVAGRGDLSAARVARDGSFCLAGGGHLFALVHAGQFHWERRLELGLVEASAMLAPDCSSALLLGDEGVEIVDARGSHTLGGLDGLDPTAFAATWHGVDNIVLADVASNDATRFFRWDLDAGTYAMVERNDVEPVSSGHRQTIVGPGRDAMSVIWANGSVSTWRAAQRRDWRLPDDWAAESVVAVGGATRWWRLDGCRLLVLEVGGVDAQPVEREAGSLCGPAVTGIGWSESLDSTDGLHVELAATVFEWQLLPSVGVAEVLEPEGATGALAATHPGGTYRAAVAGPGRVELTDASGRPRLTLQLHEQVDGELGWVVFTPAGRYIASPGAADTLRVWVEGQSLPVTEAGWVEDSERVQRSLAWD